MCVYQRFKNVFYRNNCINLLFSQHMCDRLWKNKGKKKENKNKCTSNDELCVTRIYVYGYA